MTAAETIESILNNIEDEGDAVARLARLCLTFSLLLDSHQIHVPEQLYLPALELPRPKRMRAGFQKED